MLTARLDNGLSGPEAVPVNAEAQRRSDRSVARVLQVAECNDVAVAVLEVFGGSHNQVYLTGIPRIAVDPTRTTVGRIDGGTTAIPSGGAGDRPF